MEIKEVATALEGLALGAPQVHANLALFPLLGGQESAPDYLLLDEALERGLARVTEVSRAGSVPELAFENASAEKILLVDGDELVGAKQNRIVNLSILVGAGQKIVIPVSCVEQGRWSYRSNGFSSARRALFSSARAKKMTRVSQSLRSTGARYSDQGEIWADVAEMTADFHVESATGAMADVYESRARELEAYGRDFHPEPRQHGAVAAIDGEVAGIELFDSPAAFAKYLPKLVQSYALDALATHTGVRLCPAERAVRDFLDAIKAAAAEPFPALGEGEDIRIKGRGITGGALAAHGRLVHLAGHAVAP